MAQKVGRGIALLFHDCGTRRGWVVSSTPRPHFTPGKDPVPILQDAGWAAGSVWTGGKSRPHRDSIPTVQPIAQLVYRTSYPAHVWIEYLCKIFIMEYGSLSPKVQIILYFVRHVLKYFSCRVSYEIP